MGGGGGGKSAAASNEAAAANQRLAEQQRAEEAARQARIQQGIQAINNEFSRFNDDFYKSKSQNYLSYYQPQIERQYGQAKDNTLFQLARQGLNNSSAAAQVYGDLATDYGNQQQAVQSRANDYQQNVRAQVEQQRNSLVNQVTATANPQAAASAATNAVGNLQMIEPTGGYSPLAGLFNTFAGALGSGIQGYQYQNPGILGGVNKTPSAGGNSAKVVK